MAVGKSSLNRVANAKVIAAAEPEVRSEEHTSETPVTVPYLVCRLLLEKNKKYMRP